MKVFRLYIGCFFLTLLFSCNSSNDEYIYMCKVLQNAESIFQHPDGERIGQSEADTLDFAQELEKAIGVFIKNDDLEKAAQASLYCGYAQIETEDKTMAMKSFKEAEKYGVISGDSLTTARAQFNIAKLLFYESDYADAITTACLSDSNFGSHNDEKSRANNLIAILYASKKEYDKAEHYLEKSLELAEKAQSTTAKSKVLNNYSIFYREQGEYNNAIKYLLQKKEIDNDSTQLLMFNLNIGNIYMYNDQYDSADFYIQKAFDLSKSVKIKPETEVSIYFSLYYIAKKQGRYQESLEYHETYTVLQYNIQKEKEKKNLYNIERRYDYEALQNQMNQKIIQKQRIILTISFILLLVSIVVIGLLARQKKIRKEDERIRKELDEMKEELQKSIKPEIISEEISRQLRLIISANRIAMHANDFRKEWSPLVYKINNEKDSMFEAAAVVIERVYPGMFSAILKKHPNLNETESKVMFLSCTDLTNAEIGEILGLTVHTVNKSKSEIRKKTL